MKQAKENKIPFYKNKFLTATLILLTLFTIVAGVNAYFTYKISMEGSRYLLETRATDIAVNLGFSLERLGLNKDIFSDLVSSDRWEYLAFLALIDEQKTCILHSNQKLIGRKMDDAAISQLFKEERIIAHCEELATGEKVFILDFPLKLHGKGQDQLNKPPGNLVPSKENNKIKPEPKPGLKVYCLRVALHPYPAMYIQRKAKIQLGIMIFALTLLWVLAVFFIRAWLENYRLEKSLAEKEQMAALGQMAAVLAHEIRNPLSTIKGFAQIYMEDDENPELKEDMKIIVEQVNRLERLTANLLVYAKPAKLYVEQFELSDFCKELRKILPTPTDAVVQIECGEGLVETDKEKLQQVVINLVQNSLEAMKNTDDRRLTIELKRDDGSLHLIVEDSGPGFPEDEGEDILKPFFTTKNKGTGLGLAIVKRLVEAMNGDLHLGRSTMGGAKVEIIFNHLGEEI